MATRETLTLFKNDTPKSTEFIAITQPTSFNITKYYTSIILDGCYNRKIEQ